MKRNSRGNRRIMWTQPIRNALILCLAAGWMSVVAPDDAVAQRKSLWERRSPRMVDRYSDVKANRPGDLLVITINQRSDVRNKDNRKMGNTANSTSKLSGDYGLSGALGGGAGGLTADHETEAIRNFKGNTEFKSEREFLDTFTVTVVDVLENGNMLVSGTRDVWIGDDKRRLVLTGIVRPADVTPTNTVPSSQVGDLMIRYAKDQAEGAEDRFLNQGWLGRHLNRWLPF